MFKPKLPQQDQGFMLVEVLVAILITSFFVAVTMQGMVIAALFKARAQEFAEATTWIQEDLEDVKYKAANFKYTSLTNNANSGAPSITVASLADFAVNDRLRVGSDPGNYRISAINGNVLTITPTLGTNQSQNAAVVATTVQSTSLTANANSGAPSITVASVANFAVNDKVRVGTNTGIYTINGISGTALNITPSLGTNQSQGAAVVLNTMCNPAAQNAGFADGLRDSIIGSNQTVTTNVVDISKTSSRTNKTFTLRRSTTLSSAAPYNVLQVSYDVSPTSGGSSLTSNATSGASSINVASLASFAVNDTLRVGSAPGNYRISAINGNVLTITPTLGTAQSQGAVVIEPVANFYIEVIPNAALQCP